jgi:hypothetical protein
MAESEITVELDPQATSNVISLSIRIGVGYPASA